MDLNRNKILLAAIEHRGLMAIQRTLKKANHGVALQLFHTIPALREYLDAQDAGKSADPHLVIVDLTVPTHFGIEVLRCISKRGRATKRLGAAAIVATGNLSLTLDAFDAGAIAVLTAPVSESEVRELILRFERAVSQQLIGRVESHSPAIAACRA